MTTEAKVLKVKICAITPHHSHTAHNAETAGNKGKESCCCWGAVGHWWRKPIWTSVKNIKFMLFAQRSPAASQRATAPLLATNGAAALGRKQLAGDSKSKGAVNPKARQGQIQAESKNWRDVSVFNQTRSAWKSLSLLQLSSCHCCLTSLLVSTPLVSLSDAVPSVFQYRHCISTSFKLFTFFLITKWVD